MWVFPRVCGEMTVFFVTSKRYVRLVFPSDCDVRLVFPSVFDERLVFPRFVIDVRLVFPSVCDVRLMCFQVFVMGDWCMQLLLMKGWYFQVCEKMAVFVAILKCL